MSAESVANGVVVAGSAAPFVNPLTGQETETENEDATNEASNDGAAVDTDTSTTEVPDWAKDPKSALEYAEKLRKENAKFRTRAKEFADDAKYQEALDALNVVKEQKLASLSDVERAQTEAKESAERAEQLEFELTVFKAANKYKLPDDMLEFLTGNTPEEIFAKAERLAGYVPQANRPVADRSQGMTDVGLPSKEDAIRNIFDFTN